MVKIGNFIKKFWFIFAIIGVYLLLSVFNILPRGINIFKKKNLLIDDTPVLVKEIRELGELTTCEFYGEVYADLNEVYDDLIIRNKDSILLNPTAFYMDYSGLQEYMKSSEGYINHEIKFNSVKERYEIQLTEYTKKLEAFQSDEKLLKEELVKTADNKKERKQLEKRYEDLKDKFVAEKKTFEAIRDEYKEASNKYSEKRMDFWETRKKRNLVYIGRGWVKAGINLKNMTEEDMIIDNGDSSSIQILIDDPTILDADINPWFIYTDEKKVKGYEVFLEKTGSILSDKNFTDKEITNLKVKCKDKLKSAALEIGLLKNASTSAVQTLENFFRLVGFEKVSVRFKSNTEIVVKNN